MFNLHFIKCKKNKEKKMLSFIGNSCVGLLAEGMAMLCYEIIRGKTL